MGFMPYCSKKFAGENGAKRAAVNQLLSFLGVNSDLTLAGSMEAPVVQSGTKRDYSKVV